MRNKYIKLLTTVVITILMSIPTCSVYAREFTEPLINIKELPADVAVSIPTIMTPYSVCIRAEPEYNVLPCIKLDESDDPLYMTIVSYDTLPKVPYKEIVKNYQRNITKVSTRLVDSYYSGGLSSPFIKDVKWVTEAYLNELAVLPMNNNKHDKNVYATSNCSNLIKELTYRERRFLNNILVEPTDKSKYIKLDITTDSNNITIDKFKDSAITLADGCFNMIVTFKLTTDVFVYSIRYSDYDRNLFYNDSVTAYDLDRRIPINGISAWDTLYTKLDSTSRFNLLKRFDYMKNKVTLPTVNKTISDLIDDGAVLNAVELQLATHGYNTEFYKPLDVDRNKISGWTRITDTDTYYKYNNRKLTIGKLIVYSFPTKPEDLTLQ